MTTDLNVYYGLDGYGLGEYNDALSQAHETNVVRRALTPLPPPVFTGMKLQADVMLGDLVLNTIDEDGIVWVCTDIEGWWVHPDPDIPDVTRGWRDGSYDARGRWQARQLTLKGSILVTDPSQTAAARDTLIRATSLVYSGAWLKTNEDITKAAFVRLSGRPEIASVTPRGRIDFSIGLRAADPVRYSWNSEDPDGYDLVTIPCKNAATSASGAATVENLGGIKVSTFLEITGPTSGTTTIYNSTTDELFTVVDTLRGAETRTVTNKELTSGTATLTLSATHTIVAGDIITVAGVDSTFNGEYTVTDVPTTTKVSYLRDANNVALTSATGSVARAADFLEIDTYERQVGYNGVTAGARVMVDTLVDWITLDPGVNSFQFTDEGTANGTATLKVFYRSGWIG